MVKRPPILLLSLLLLACTFTVTAASGDAAGDDEDRNSPKPIMGFSPQNYFGRQWMESDLVDAVQKLLSSGMRGLGYKWILNSGGWWKGFQTGVVARDSNGEIISNPRKYTISGTVANFSAYVHANGFLYGHYMNAGVKSCSGDVGIAQSDFTRDISSFVRWNMDLLRVDSCGLPLDNNAVLRKTMTSIHNLVAKLTPPGHAPIRISNCRVGCMTAAGVTGGHDTDAAQCSVNPYFTKQPKWCAATADQVRLGSDIRPCYFSVMNSLEAVIGSRLDVLPDSDYFEIGNNDASIDREFKFLKGYKPGGLTWDEQVSQVSLWAVTSNPLVISTNMATVTPDVINLLKNVDMIQINQKFVLASALTKADLPFRFGNRLIPTNPKLRWKKAVAKTVWYKPLPGMRAALVFHNRIGSSPISVSLRIRSLPRFAGTASATTFDVKDVWGGSVTSGVSEVGVVSLAPHASKFFLISLSG